MLEETGTYRLSPPTKLHARLEHAFNPFWQHDPPTPTKEVPQALQSSVGPTRLPPSPQTGAGSSTDPYISVHMLARI